jgi:plasmid maintenance system antidote protein VapI
MPKNQHVSFDDLFQRVEQDPAYWVDRAILDFTDEVARTMGEHEVSRAELARRIGSSQAYVSKVLNSNANFTIGSMVKLGRALGSEVRFHLAHQGSRTIWFDEMLTYKSYSVAACPPQATIAYSWAAPEPDAESEGHYQSLSPSAKDDNAALAPAA